MQVSEWWNTRVTTHTSHGSAIVPSRPRSRPASWLLLVSRAGVRGELSAWPRESWAIYVFVKSSSRNCACLWYVDLDTSFRRLQCFVQLQRYIAVTKKRCNYKETLYFFWPGFINIFIAGYCWNIEWLSHFSSSISSFASSLTTNFLL